MRWYIWLPIQPGLKNVLDYYFSIHYLHFESAALGVIFHNHESGDTDRFFLFFAESFLRLVLETVIGGNDCSDNLLFWSESDYTMFK